MSRKKVSVIFGTRPEAIKLAPVIRALKESEDFEPHVCVTGVLLHIGSRHPHKTERKLADAF